jgi:hypothetical protein
MAFREIPPPNYDYNANKLAKAYKKAIRDIQKELRSLPIDDLRQAHAKAVLAEIAKILKGINKECEAWVDENIPLAAKDGVARTLVSIGEVKTLEEALEIAKFNRINKAMVDAVIADTYTDLLAVTQNVDRKTRAVVRQAVSESMRANMTTGVMGRRTINNDTLTKIRETLESATSTGIIDSAGRRWQPSVYVDMVTRTKLQQTHIKATRNEAVAREAYYGVISSHGAVDSCKYHEGRIIKLVPEALGDYPTYEELQLSGQIFHPNCRHIVTPLRSVELLTDKRLEKAERQAIRGDKALKTGKRNPTDEELE